MVGVPGRSKGCNTCRKRKKGCDLKRPHCDRCQKAGIACSGYGRKAMFVNKNTQDMSFQTSRTSSPESAASTIALRRGLAYSAFEAKYVGMFFDEYLPSGKTLSAHSVKDTLGGMTNAMENLHLTDGVLRKSILALSLGTAGRRDGEDWMVKEGLRVYISAIHDMSSALRTPSRAQGDALFTASKMFILYEKLFGSIEDEKTAQFRSWNTHCSGEIAMLGGKEPEDYVTGYAHGLFTFGRAHHITSAILFRRKSILSNEDWKTRPWKNTPKTLRDTILDILVDIPTMMEDMDNTPIAKMDSFVQQELVDRFSKFFERLDQWYESVFEPQEFGLPDPHSTSPLSVEDLALTHIMTLYWSTCLAIHALIPDEIRYRVNYGYISQSSDEQYFCRRIILALPIFLRPDVGMYRVHLASFPLGTLLTFLGLRPNSYMGVEKALLAEYLSWPEAAIMKLFFKNLDLGWSLK